MNALTPRHILVLFGLLVFLVTGQAGVQGDIWCLGENGHTALEYGAGTTCVSNAQREWGGCQEAESPECQVSHCTPCIDVPTAFDATARRMHGQPDYSAPEGTGPASTVSSDISVSKAHLYPQQPPRICQTILVHRTVVLLN